MICCEEYFIDLISHFENMAKAVGKLNYSLESGCFIDVVLIGNEGINIESCFAWENATTIRFGQNIILIHRLAINWLVF